MTQEEQRPTEPRQVATRERSERGVETNSAPVRETRGN